MMRPLLAAAILSVLTQAAPMWSTAALAGEISGALGSCDLGSIFGCKWEPKGCSKPSPPYLYADDVESYNRAVTEFNIYVDEMQSYETCVINEAKRDASDRVTDVIADGAKKAISDAGEEVSEVRANLEIMRPR